MPSLADGYTIELHIKNDGATEAKKLRKCQTPPASGDTEGVLFKLGKFSFHLTTKFAQSRFSR